MDVSNFGVDVFYLPNLIPDRFIECLEKTFEQQINKRELRKGYRKGLEKHIPTNVNLEIAGNRTSYLDIIKGIPEQNRLLTGELM